MSTIQIKCTNGEGFKIKIPLESTVAELKNRCKEQTKIDPAEQKLIYKGKILKDEEILNSTGIGDNHVVILIRSSKLSATKPAAAPQQVSSNPQQNTQQPNPQQNPFPTGGQAPPNFGGDYQNILNNPDLMLQSMQNPMVQEMMRNLMNNPELVRTFLQNNPLLQGSEGNPQLNDQMRRLAENPQMMQSMMRMFSGQWPSAGVGQHAAASPPDANAASNFSSFLQSQAAAPSNPAPSPGVQPTAFQPPTPSQDTDWETVYKSQLEQLEGMGFTDRTKNIALLKQTNGNVSIVIDRLLQ